MQPEQTSAETSSPQSAKSDATRGFLFAFSAYSLWGFLPLYMKAVEHISPVEVVAHRAIWSVPIAGILLIWLGRTADISAAFRSPRTLIMAALTAAIISLNWGVYIWAIAAGRAVETALGYYINPLVTLLFGVLFLGERFNRMQLVAIALAALAVVILTIETGGLPWVSLFLAFTFAAYGFLKKTLPIGPSQGFFLEVLILSVPSLAYIVWLGFTGTAHFLATSYDTWILLLAGPITAIPLILYGLGAKLLRISTIGLMQYIAPSLIALIAVFVFKEPFGSAQLTAFALIWGALILYTWSMFFGKKPE